MIRSMVKAAAAATLQRTGMAALIGAHSRKAVTPLVVGYHRVVDDFESHARACMPSLLITTRTLEKQLDWIGRRYEFADPDGMDAWLNGARPDHKPVAVVTFDDGYRDVYDHAFPLLRRKGIPAVFFMVTDLIGTNALQIHDELYVLMTRALPTWKEPRKDLERVLAQAKVNSFTLAGVLGALHDAAGVTRALLSVLTQAQVLRIMQVLRLQVGPPREDQEFAAMDWDMLAEMQRHGMKIGSHTRSHALLTNESAEKIRNELRGSRRALENRLGPGIRHFAYPDGRFDALVLGAMVDAGYRFGYGTCLHRHVEHPALTIPRRLLWEKSSLDAFGQFSPSVMSCQVNGIFDFAGRHCGASHMEGIS
ncbi:MAG TPA: polysaccharide deacetylase family protein [Gammaproteobacteria bacterium]|nr:polysaccharide deacetylase family protein [Gammaproteobacteria bacterium]